MTELLRLQKFFQNAKEEDKDGFVNRFTDGLESDLAATMQSTPGKQPLLSPKAKYSSPPAIQSSINTTINSTLHNNNSSYVAVKNSMNIPNGSTGATIDTYIEKVMDRIGETINTDEKLVDVMGKMEAEIHREQDVHSREEEIRDAVRAKAAFLKSKAGLTSSQQQLQSLHRDFGNDLSRKLLEIANELKRNNRLLTEFSEHAKGDFHPEYTISTMVTECNLQVTHERMKELLQENMADPSSALQILDSLLTSSHTPHEEIAMKEELVSYGVGKELTDLIMQLHGTLNSDQLESEVAIQSLQKTEESIPNLQTTLARTEQSCNKAMADSDLESVEALQMESLENYKKMLGLVQQRLALLIGSGRDNITEGVKQKYETSNTLVSEVAQRCDKIDGLLEEDAKKLVTSHDLLKETRTKESEATSAAITELDADISDNERQQMAISQQIASLQQSYKELSSSRDKLVTERVRILEEDECKQRLFEVQCRTQQQHLKMMQDVKDHLTIVNQLHKFVDRWVSTAVSGISRKMARAESDLRSIRLEEHKRHLDVFTRYFLFNGELIFKKAERVREYTRLIRHSECSAKHALKVTDPQSKVYENYAKELSAVRDVCVEEIEVLRKNCQQASADFESTAEALTQANISFTHPEVLLRKQTAELKQISVSHRTQLFEADRRENEEEMAELNKLISQFDA